MMMPRLSSPFGARLYADSKILGAEFAGGLLVLCTFSKTKRLRHSGITKPFGSTGDPDLLLMRCSSTRFAHFDQFERFSRSPWHQPGDRSSCRRQGAPDAGRD